MRVFTYMDLINLLQTTIKQVIREKHSLDLLDVFIEHPANMDFGDYATNISMKLAKELKCSPMVLSKTIVEELLKADLQFTFNSAKYPIFSGIYAVPPGFINFKLSREFLNSILQNIRETRETYGSENIGKGERIALEHSNVNPNKATHVGHLRNACIGQFLERIYEYLGYNVEVQYYHNDVGVQVATSYMSLSKVHKFQRVDYRKFDLYMWDMYAEMESMIQENPELQKERDALMIKLESPNNPEFVQQRAFANQILVEQLKTFQNLDFDYDVIIHESDIIALGFWEKTFNLLRTNKNVYLADDGPSKGCWLIRLHNDAEPSVKKDPALDVEEDKIIVRSNGVPTYTAKDIAYHLWKFGLLGEDFGYVSQNYGTQAKILWETSYDTATKDSKVSFSKVSKVLNVIDVKQTYAMSTVKEMLRYLGYEAQASNMVHVNYGFVYLSPGTAKKLGIDISDNKDRYGMSGRKGWGIKVDDFIDMVDSHLTTVYGEFAALREVRNGAIKFELLKYNTFQDLVFDLDAALSIKGFSGPYVQYTYARACSILSKNDLDLELSTKKVWQYICNDTELEVLKYLIKFPDIINLSASEYAPNILCNYLFDLSQKYNAFYNAYVILDASNKETSSFRVALTEAVSYVLKRGLFLLGINAPTHM